MTWLILIYFLLSAAFAAYVNIDIRRLNANYTRAAKSHDLIIEYIHRADTLAELKFWEGEARALINLYRGKLPDEYLDLIETNFEAHSTLRMQRGFQK